MIKIYRVIKKLLNKKERNSLVKVLSLAFLMAIFDSIGIVSVMPFLSVASNAQLIETNAYLAYFYEKSVYLGVVNYNEFLVVLGLASFVILLLSSVYRVFTQFTLNNFIELRRHSIGMRLFTEYMGKEYEFFLNKNTSSMSKNILSEVDLVVQQVLRPIVQMIVYGLVVFVMLILLIVINPLISLIVGLVFGGLYILFYSMARNKLKEIGLKRSLGNEGRFLAVSEAFGGIKALKLGKHEKVYLEKFRPHSYSYSKSQSLAVTINQVPQYLVEALAIGGVILVTIIAILSLGGVGSNAFSKIVPMIGLYVFAAYRIQPALRSVYQGIASIKYGASALETLLNAFRGTKSDFGSRSERIPRLVNSLKFENVLSLCDIEFTYANSKQLAVDKVSFNIEKNSLIAVIGPSGSGKTTLIDVMLGLLTPQNGNITVDDCLLNSENVGAYQKLIGYVPQDIYLIDASIAENIAFGISLCEVDFDRVKKVARMANLSAFCDGLEGGYYSQVGERGSNLSGGQKQRIGIARALYKDPQILVLDESTSALDSDTEKQILSTITGLKGSLTVVFITHKTSMIRDFDNILYLASGKKVDFCDYDTLKELHPKVFK